MADPPDSNHPLRSVSSVLGDLVRRVSTVVSEVSETVTLPESLRQTLDEARHLRFQGEFDAADAALRRAWKLHPDHDALRRAMALGRCHQVVLACGDELDPSEQLDREDRVSTVRSEPDKEGDPAATLLPADSPVALLLVAARILAEGLHPTNQAATFATTDALRRAGRGREQLATFEGPEFSLIEHLIAARAHEAAGANERAIRELQKARGRLPAKVGAPMRRWLLARGTRLLLAEARPHEAALWVYGAQRLRLAAENSEDSEDTRHHLAPDDRDLQGLLAQDLEIHERVWLARTFAARGDRDAAKMLAQHIPDDSLWAEAHLCIALGVGDAQDARARSLLHLQGDAHDPRRLRLWALSEFSTWDLDITAPASGAKTAVLDALLTALERVAPILRAARLQELAHIVLWADLLDSRAADRIMEALDDPNHRGSTEERLVRVRGRLARRAPLADIDVDFLPGPPRHFRRDPSRGQHVLGSDELSPLRQPLGRKRTVVAQMRLAEAERALVTREGGAPREVSPLDREHAEIALVQSLEANPELPAARRLLAHLAQPEETPTLEALLGASTRLLARAPTQVLGVPLAGVADGLARVVAARERLARPLTIAIMGEFSSGKSTFVNALLGQRVAPMGVLPTTSTINVFRRGPSGGARVHDREGRISTVSADDLQDYLCGLDDQEAKRIRYVEIERGLGGLGDTAVVDTPGLNALDPYHERVAREFLDEADAVVWVFSATRGSTASEAEVLRELRDGGRRVLGVLNKVDTLEGDEVQELSAYLREQLGDVLVDVIALCATEALDFRVRGQNSGSAPADQRDADGSANSASSARSSNGGGVADRGDQDPFRPVDEALELHFLRHARELKLQLTRTRLREALVVARDAVQEASAVLNSRSEATTFDATRRLQERALARFVADLRLAIEGLDDPLARECLSLGLVEIGVGQRRNLEHEDFEYLDALVESLAVRAIRDTLAQLSGEHEALVSLIQEGLVPWARGYFRARATTHFARDLVTAHGNAAKEGEAALRHALRRGLGVLANDLAVEAQALAPGLELAWVRTRRESSSAPRAQALRLQFALAAGLDLLIERTREDPATGTSDTSRTS